MILTREPQSVRVWAPAKLNLFLEILDRRADGYHEIETLMVAIGICDTIDFSATDEDRLRTDVPDFGWMACAGESPAMRRPVCWGLFRRARTTWWCEPWSGCARQRASRRVRACELVKRIPAAAGLGGASSDAAAAMAAANMAWNLGWSSDRLAELAASLGSDIPFFFGGGAGIARGRGETDRIALDAQRHARGGGAPSGWSAHGGRLSTMQSGRATCAVCGPWPRRWFAAIGMPWAADCTINWSRRPRS